MVILFIVTIISIFLLGDERKRSVGAPATLPDVIIEITVQSSGELCYGEDCEKHTVGAYKNSKIVWKCKDEENNPLTFSIRFRTKSPVQEKNPNVQVKNSNESPYYPVESGITTAIHSVNGEKTLWISPNAEDGTYKYSVAVLKGGIIFIDDPQIIVPPPKG